MLLVYLKKYWKEVLLTILFVSNIIFFNQFLNYKNKAYTEALINRSRLAELQTFDEKLGLANANLMRQEELSKKYKVEIDELKEDLKSKMDDLNKKDLDILSRDKTIVALKNKVKSGSSTTTTTVIKDDKEVQVVIDVKEVCDKVIQYTWKDEHERFELFDPDISISGNEEFLYQQYLIITGLVLTDESGNLQIRRVKATEAIKDKDGNFKPLDDSNVQIVDANFEYSNLKLEEKKFKWTDPITLRPMASFDTALMPGVGLELLNLGRAIPYANFGLVPKIAVDVSDPLNGSLQNSRIGVGVVYHIGPPLVDTNFAIGLSLMTPFNQLGVPMLTIDVGGYLTQDLYPRE